MLAQRIFEVLENQEDDELPLTRFEICYARETGRSLMDDLNNNGHTLKGILENGLCGKNRKTYLLLHNEDNQRLIVRQRTELSNPTRLQTRSLSAPSPVPSLFHLLPSNPRCTPTVRLASISEIYDECSKELEENTFGEIPLEYLEEKVEERLLSKSTTLGERRTGENFVNIVQRASGTFIRGIVLNGKLYHPSLSPNSNTNQQSKRSSERRVPPLCQPRLRQPHKAFCETIIDSDDDVFTDDDFCKISPCPPTVLKSTVRPFMNIPNSYLEKIQDRSANAVKGKLLNNKPWAMNAFESGSNGDLEIQRRAIQQCCMLWENKIKNFSEFLFIMKLFAASHPAIDVLDIQTTMFDKIIDPFKVGHFPWELFGINEDDLAPFCLLVRSAKENLIPCIRNQIEVHPAIQRALFHDISEFTEKNMIYKHLLTVKQDSIPRIAELLMRSEVYVSQELKKWSQFFLIDDKKKRVELNTPFPFFIIDKEKLSKKL